MRTASPTFSIRSAGDLGFIAVASFPSGISGGRRPITGPSSPTAGGATAALLAMPSLAYVLTAILNPAPAPDAD